MVTEPTELQVAKPELLMVAMVVLEELQLAEFVTFC